MHRILGFISLLALPLVAIGRAIDRALDVAMALWPPSQPRLATDTYGFARTIDGQAVPRALQNSLRHEAGQSKRAAGRRN